MALTASITTALKRARFGTTELASQIFAPSVRAGPGDRHSIALTFDDGPSPGTLPLLDYLEVQGVRATFFQCGANVLRHPDITLAVDRAGHEIGNHTFSHPRLCPRFGWQINLRGKKEILQEFAQTQAILQDLGTLPRLLRVPYGLSWFGMRDVQRLLNLTSVLWTVIGRDWELEATAAAALVLRKSTPGGIICLHDGRDTRAAPNIQQTLDAVKLIVPALKQRGYGFETVSEILQR